MHDCIESTIQIARQAELSSDRAGQCTHQRHRGSADMGKRRTIDRSEKKTHICRLRQRTSLAAVRHHERCSTLGLRLQLSVVRPL